jgi:hypothetical protein
MAGLNVDQILAKLGRQKTAEQKLAEGLSEKPAEEIKAETSVEEISKVADPVAEVAEPVVEEAPVEAAPVEEAPVEAAPVEAAPAEEKVAEVDEEAEKIKEAEATGAIMARSFYAELNKLAEADMAEVVTEAKTEAEEIKEAEEVKEEVKEAEAEVEETEELSKQAQVLVNLYNKIYGGEE